MPLRQQKYKKHIPGVSQKHAYLSGWSYAPRYSCRSKAKVNCFLHTKKRYATKTITNYHTTAINTDKFYIIVSYLSSASQKRVRFTH